MKNWVLITAFLGLSIYGQSQTLAGYNGDCTVGGQQVGTQSLYSTQTKPINSSTPSKGAGVMASYPACHVTVYLTGTTNKATIYATSVPSPGVLPNPFTANVDGSFLFFVAPGSCYDVVISTGTGPTLPATRTYTDVCEGIGTGGGGGGGGSGTVTSVGVSGLNPLFSTSVTTPTTTPSFTFALLPANPQTVFGNCTSIGSNPSYCSINAAMLPATITSNTTGTALNLTGPALLPNGTTVATQAPGDSSADAASDAFVAAAISSSGGGNVSNSGTPAANQLAIWNNATTIKGVLALPAANFPALTGDCTTTAGALATACTKTGGVAFGAFATSVLTPPASAVVGISDTQTLTNKSISGSEVNSGTLPHAQLPTLLSGDIPNNAANTTGQSNTTLALAAAPTLCSAGFSPTGILANGTATGCQAVGGSPAFGSVAAGTNTNALLVGSGGSLGTTGTGTISANQLNGTPSLISAPAFGQAVIVGTGPTIINAYPGVGVDVQAGATFTVHGDGAGSDRVALVNTTNNTTSTAGTIAAAGSTGFAFNYTFADCNSGTVAQTLTPATSSVNGNASIGLLAKVAGNNPECAFIWSDNANYYSAVIPPTDSLGRVLASAMPPGIPVLSGFVAGQQVISASSTSLANSLAAGVDVNALAGATWDAKLQTCITAGYAICNMHALATPQTSSSTPITIPSGVKIIWPHGTLVFALNFTMTFAGANRADCVENDWGCVADASGNGGPGIFTTTGSNIWINGMKAIGGLFAVAGGSEFNCSGGTNVHFIHDYIVNAGGSAFNLGDCSGSSVEQSKVDSAGGICYGLNAASIDSPNDKFLNNVGRDCNIQQLAGNGDININSGGGQSLLHDVEIAGNYISNGEQFDATPPVTLAASGTSLTGAGFSTGWVGWHATVYINGTANDFKITAATGTTLTLDKTISNPGGIYPVTYRAHIYASCCQPANYATLQGGSGANNTVTTSDNGTTTTITCNGCSSKFSFVNDGTWTATPYKIKVPNTSTGKVCTIATVVSGSSLTVTDSTCVPSAIGSLSQQTALEVSAPSVNDTGSSECIQATALGVSINIHDNTCFNIGAEGITASSNKTWIHDNIMRNVGQDSPGTGCYISSIQNIIGGGQNNITIEGNTIQHNKCFADSDFGVPAGGVAQPAGNPGGSVNYCMWQNVGGTTSGGLNAFRNLLWEGQDCVVEGANGHMVNGFQYSDSSFATLVPTAAANASGGNTVYTVPTGTIVNNILVGNIYTFSGFSVNPAQNNGTFTVVASTPTNLTVNNPSGIAESGGTYQAQGGAVTTLTNINVTGNSYDPKITNQYNVNYLGVLTVGTITFNDQPLATLVTNCLASALSTSQLGCSSLSDNTVIVSGTKGLSLSPTLNTQVALTLNNPSGSTANIANFGVNGTLLADIDKNGAFIGDHVTLAPVSTTQAGASVNLPSGTTAFEFIGKNNGGTNFTVDASGNVNGTLFSGTGGNFSPTVSTSPGMLINMPSGSTSANKALTLQNNGSLTTYIDAVGNLIGQELGGSYVQIRGTKFTTSGCSISTTLGGPSAGSYASGTTGTCTVTVTMGGSVTATNGWACWVSDLTTPADVQHQTLPVSTTQATFSGTTVSGDVVNFGCEAY